MPRKEVTWHFLIFADGAEKEVWADSRFYPDAANVVRKDYPECKILAVTVGNDPWVRA